MVRRSFALKTLMVLLILLAAYLITNLFAGNKTLSDYILAWAGFVILPIVATVTVLTAPELQQISKVVIITGVWVAWTSLAGIATFATYFYWYNSSYYGCTTYLGGCCNGLCSGGFINQ